MPVFTAAVIAVSVAVTTTTVATVAAAVIAVSVAVGVVGTALSVIGTIIKDKTLMDVGKYMGYASIAGGLAGSAAGGSAGYSDALSQAWQADKAIFSSGADVVADMSMAQVAPSAAQPIATPPTITGQAPPAGTEMITGAAPVPDTIAAAAQQGTTAAGAPIAQPELLATAPQATPTTQPPVIPAQPGVPTTPVPGSYVPATELDIAKAYQPTVANMSGGIPAKALTESVQTWLDKLPDYVKGSVLIGGGQAVAGAAGGYFEGASAEQIAQRQQFTAAERLELERVIANEKLKRGTSAPLVTFSSPSGPAGLINSPRKG